MGRCRFFFYFVLLETVGLVGVGRLTLAQAKEKSKTVNFSLNPAQLAFGQYVGSVDFYVDKKFTFGITAGYLNYASGSESLTSASVGLRLNAFLTAPAFADGLYLTLKASYNPMVYVSGLATASFGAFDLDALLGYQWMWNSGFNIKVGAGAAYFTTPNFATMSDKASRKVPAFTAAVPQIEAAIGYAF